MIRDLSKTVPPAVLAAAGAVLKESDLSHRHMRLAFETRAAHLAAARGERVRDQAELEKLADGLFNWGTNLRQCLPSQALYARFRTRDGDGPNISVVNEEIALEPVDGAAGGRLNTELKLHLFPDSGWLFRRYEKFDGYLVHGGDQLNTPVSLQLGLHPKMLRSIHRRIADGDVWTRVEHGLRTLLTDSLGR